MKKGNLVRTGFIAILLSSSLAAHANFNTLGSDISEIVGGTTVKASDAVASSTVMLLANAGDPQSEYLCTGSLIAEDIIVTAAHCVAATPDKIQIIFGLNVDSNWSPTSSDQVMSITGYQANPNYKGENFQGNDMGDIALIHISGPLPSGYAPATLLPADEALTAGETTLLAGYGITSGKTQKGAGTLREVNAPIGGTVGQTEVSIDETHRKGSCSGDSGGPAFIQKGSQLYLWGVTSRGDQYCAQEGIYTRITAYDSWINQTMNELRR